MKLPLPFSRSIFLFLILGLCGSGIAAEKKPLKVFLLVGQSNMQGHAHVRTFEHLGMDPETAPILEEMQDANGTPRICDDVWISYLSSGGEKEGQLTAGFGADENKIGPELTFGIYMQKRLNEPVLLIKTAWGGKSINTDFRPPSAGPYQFSESQLEGFKAKGKNIEEIKAAKEAATGHYYRQTIDYAKKVLADIKQVYPGYDPKQGYELAGFVWFQGWNDMVARDTYPNRDKPGGYDDYSKVLAHFIRDVRKDLSAPGMPFVIGVMGTGGPVEKYGPDQQRYKGVHQNFRLAMAAPAAMPEFKDKVVSVLTENFWDLDLNALTARDAKVKQEAKKIQKEKNLKGKEAQAVLEELRAREFSDTERKILEVGISNAGYHYLGSAKIMARIGKGFAEAMIVKD